MLLFERIRLAISCKLVLFTQHPMYRGIYLGHLPKPVFHAFLMQDKIYLAAFANALKVTAHRLKNSEHQAIFHDLAYDVSETERHLHKYLMPLQSPRFFSTYLSPPKILPSVQTYIHHLETASQDAALHIAVASVIPCFYLYSQLGQTMMQAEIGAANPYRLWINSCISSDFLSSNKKIVSVMNALGEELSSSEEDQAIQTVLQSTDLEIGFWNEIESNYLKPYIHNKQSQELRF